MLRRHVHFKVLMLAHCYAEIQRRLHAIGSDAHVYRQLFGQDVHQCGRPICLWVFIWTSSLLSSGPCICLLSIGLEYGVLIVLWFHQAP